MDQTIVRVTASLLQIHQSHMWIRVNRSSSIIQRESVDDLHPNLVLHELKVFISFVRFDSNLACMKLVVFCDHKHVLIPMLSHVRVRFHLLDPFSLGQVVDAVRFVQPVVKPLS